MTAVKLLVISPDVVDSRMAGPGIRSWELARALVPHASVTLATPNTCSLADSGITIQSYGSDGAALKRLVEQSDVVLMQGFVLHDFPFVKEIDQPLIVDIYDPLVIENLEAHDFRSMAERHNVHNRDLAVIVEQLSVGDFFICANERQRDYWMGMLSATGRINPYNYRFDRSLRKLIDVVPFGLSDGVPQLTRPVLKGVRSGIGANDRLVIWGGGIWPWLDPLTLIQAMKVITTEHKDVKLFFMGNEHPNPDIAAVLGNSLHAHAVRLSKDLGLYNKTVFFNDRWVPYGDRHNCLLEADIGVCLHQNFIEMRYAYRTRYLDYVWCGLPIIASLGDSWSKVVEEFGLGKVVANKSVDQVVAALNEMLAIPNLREAYGPRFAKVREKLSWHQAVRPLVDFLSNPRKAPDKLAQAN
ncbi:MAG: glycosyltransferase family 4 protein [Chloroflexi bacterium]|nr:glycosyltransferase family 4 protein [Chloroflexota bacterium]